MNKRWAVLTFCFMFPFAMFAQTAMKTHTILNGRVSIELPADFKTKSSTEDAPIEWTDQKDSIILLYHLSVEDSISDNDIPSFVDDQLRLAKLDGNDFQYIDDGIYLQDGKNIGFLKFSAEESREKYFNYMFFVSIDNRLLAITFISLFEHRKKWEPIADTIANSIRVQQEN